MGIRTYVVFVAALAAMTGFAGGCAAGYRIGMDQSKNAARVDACSFWCDHRINDLTRKEYFDCLEECDEWQCQ